jgi:formyltetrahydrofolate-dependent phosphoribosylglycinamide formyltransferase
VVNIAVFASGSGTNFEEIIKHVEDGSLKCNVQALICDKEAAYALQRAKNHNIPAYYFNPKAYENKAAYETAILSVLKELDVDLIVLSGYMRFIGQTLLQAYPQRIINIHPAYLPEFPGAHGILDAYNAKVSQTGVTVHYVDEGVDTGPVIAQERVAIDSAWSLEELECAVHAKEYDLFWRVIAKVCDIVEKENVTL